jgi:tetratricopeptide (TPR) repeat protein
METKSRFEPVRAGPVFEGHQLKNSQDPSPSLPPDIPSIFSQALACHQTGRLADAERLYRVVLRSQPLHFNSLNLLGLLLYQRGEYTAAMGHLDLALTVSPNDAAAYNYRGATLKELGRPDDALASYSKAIALNPKFADAYYNRGNVLKEQRRFEEALTDYDQAIALNPDHADALNSRGAALRALRRLEEALASYGRAIALKPDNADALYNRSNVLNELKRFEEALTDCDQAIAIRPNLTEAFNNRGNALKDLGRREEAIASYDRAIALKPDYADAYNNRGTALLDLKRMDEALASYAQAIAIKPDYADGFWNRALCRLLLGRCNEGWSDYEWRWNTDRMAPERRNFKRPQWFGKTDIAGKSILLHAEQGYGDAIMAARYVRRVIEKGARVILEAPAPLVPLLAEIEGVLQVVAKGYQLPAFELHCPFMSLPLAFGTTLSTIPAGIPYLSVPKMHAEKWLQRLPRSDKPRVGITWTGSPTHKRDHERSIALRRMLPVLSRTDLQLFSVQKFLREEDAEILQDHPHITNLGDSIETFADTAAIISTLDLVLSVDTSVVHLAGALGKPVWIMLPFVPDWRWLLDRDDSPWYPTARLFRQSRIDDWEGVIEQVSKKLSIFTASSAH